jgi:membrane-associated phospholipid phosphatase
MFIAGIATLIIAETLLSLAIFSAVIAVLVFLVRAPLRKYKPLDMAVFDRLNATVTPSNNRMMTRITFLGSHHFLVPSNLLLIFSFLFIGHKNWFSIRVLTISLSSLVLMMLLKALFRRKRPLSPLLHAAKGLSFPSGHAIMAVTFYGLLVYIIMNSGMHEFARWLLVIASVLLILLIGFSRVYLRVHYASDVLAGFVIGLLWLLISLNVLNHLESDYREIQQTETSNRLPT